MKKSVFLLCLILFGFSSCVEIIDDLTIHNDGTGTFRYTVNLSSSKVRVNSILALDSLDGKKVPDIAEIKAKVQTFIKTLDAQSGISNVKVEENYTDFVFKFQCDFTSLSQLQDGIKTTLAAMTKENMPEMDYNWLTWDGNKLTRSIPNITKFKVNELKDNDIENLKKGTYTSISRFDRAVDHFENNAAILSKSKLAVMVKTDTYTLKENQNVLENVIYLVSNKNR